MDQGHAFKAEQKEFHSLLDRVPSSSALFVDLSATDNTIHSNETGSFLTPVPTAAADHADAVAQNLNGSAGCGDHGVGASPQSEIEGVRITVAEVCKGKKGPLTKLKWLLSELLHYRYAACCRWQLVL